MWVIGGKAPPTTDREVAIIRDREGQVYHDDVAYFFSEDAYTYRGTLTENGTVYHCFDYTEGV